MHIQHKLSYPDEAEVTLTIKCSVYDARMIAGGIAASSRPSPASEQLMGLLNAVIEQAQATLYARPEEPKSST